jgi:hypothetical protein
MAVPPCPVQTELALSQTYWLLADRDTTPFATPLEACPFAEIGVISGIVRDQSPRTLALADDANNSTAVAANTSDFIVTPSRCNPLPGARRCRS